MCDFSSFDSLIIPITMISGVTLILYMGLTIYCSRKFETVEKESFSGAKYRALDLPVYIRFIQGLIMALCWGAVYLFYPEFFTAIKCTFNLMGSGNA